MQKSIILNNKEFVLIGQIGVDAGLCWIGDPCYILHTKDLPEAVGKDWGEFVDKFYGVSLESPQYKSFDYDGGYGGLGVCTSTGYGDGVYNVYAYFDEVQENRIMGVFIDYGCQFAR